MSNTLAVAAVTTALRNLLLDQVPKRDSELSDLGVTTRTPDAARKNVNGVSLNLFLYQTAVNAGWSNLDAPRSVHAGESGHPPLPLNLRYLLTSFGRDDADQDAVSQRALSGAMSVLHDHPVLGADELRDALPGSELADQVERLRLSPLPLGVDDMSKLWTAFQSPYRLSCAYEVTVVLIDSTLPARTPLPVLRRGQQDRGVVATTGTAPVLRALQPPRAQPAARLGEDVLVDGDRLSDATMLRFQALLPDPPPAVDLPRSGPTADDLPGAFVVRPPDLSIDPDAFVRWVCGLYRVTAVEQRPDTGTLVSNVVGFALAPSITIAPNSTDGPATPGSPLTVTCGPRIRDGQDVGLLFGDQQLLPTAVTNPAAGDPNQTPTTLTFEVPTVAPGTYTVRLRVDGVDSVPVDFGGAVVRFDPVQQVSVP